MKQTFDEFGDALIAGIEEESAAANPVNANKNNMAEMFAAFEQKMSDKLNGIESQVSAISDIKEPHTETEPETEPETDNSTITDESTESED